jgi:acetyltransferase-like isoleucine patch superfamily enzyme
MAKLKEVFIHPKALVESRKIGDGTRIWAFVHVLKGAVIGSHVNIGDHCFVENEVVIGDHVIIKNGISIWDGVTIEDGAFLGPNVTLTNELMPRSGFPKGLSKIIIKKGATIGANATIVTGVTLGEYCTVGAASVVTRDVLAHALVYGSFARQKGWVCICGLKLDFGKDMHATCSCGRSFENKINSISLVHDVKRT